jgi:predicted aspartyl protease
MRHPFDPSRPLVVVRAWLWGPSGYKDARLVLDTGAVNTVISRDVAELLGYESLGQTTAVRVVTGGGEVEAYRLHLHKIAALGLERCDFPVLCHALPRKARVDGLLGLNFLRGHRLLVDLLVGWVSLE